jgi:hypothetical protein
MHPTPVNQRVCENYMLGFCPKGPNCKFIHVRSFIAPQDLSLKVLANFPIEENWMDGQLHSLIGRHQMGNHGGMGGQGHGGYMRHHGGHVD